VKKEKTKKNKKEESKLVRKGKEKGKNQLVFFHGFCM
jgi:hypothetical protein